MASERDAAGLTAEERVEGERLVADMTPGEWWNESQVIHAPLGDHRASHPVSTQTDEDADAICWLRNHAAQLLVDSAELARERRRVAAALAVLNAPMWESDDETDSTICRCEWCLAATAKLAATYRCRECGYQGQPMAWGCLDSENVERMSREHGERYSLGNVTCPICGEGELEADSWKALRAIRQALADDAPGPGGDGEGR